MILLLKYISSRINFILQKPCDCNYVAKKLYTNLCRKSFAQYKTQYPFSITLSKFKFDEPQHLAIYLTKKHNTCS
jgi:hypothetical protein